MALSCEVRARSPSLIYERIEHDEMGHKDTNDPLLLVLRQGHSSSTATTGIRDHRSPCLPYGRPASSLALVH